MSDELDRLNNSELSEAVAREVLGCEVDGEGAMRMPDTSMGGQGFEHWRIIPPFAWSADAVLPLLEVRGWRGTSNRCGSTCAATVTTQDPETGEQFTAQASDESTQAPFARAACIALIRAARAKGGAK